METAERTLTGRQLKARLVERGIRMTDFARAAGMPQPNMSTILAGRDPVGPSRRARIEAAIVALGLDKEESPDPQSADQQPVFNIRSAEE